MWKHIGIFVTSFLVGCALLYISPVEHKTIIVYPTPFTAKKIQYKDQLGACYKFKSRTVPCSSESKIIP